MTFESINEVCIKWRDDIDNAILGEIKEKAIAHGIKTEYVLNKKAIIFALEKQIPKKPTPQIVKGGKRLIGNGWWCNGTTVYKCPNCNDFISRTYDYCYKCGQALDWSDTK
jgi:hypothetical protein